MKSAGKYVMIAVIMVLLIFFGIWIAYNNNDIQIFKYNVKSENIPTEFDNFRIAQISDLHNTEFGNDNENLINSLKKTDVDIIVITGDLLDSRNTDVDRAVFFAEKATDIAPVYYVNGNHEARVPEEYEKLKQGLERAGVTILENRSFDITIGESTITLIGINDPAFREKIVGEYVDKSVERQIESVVPKNDNYKILLAHRPDFFDSYVGKVQLVLSGHTHGGQFIIPFVGGLFAPGQGFFPEYCHGSYIMDNTEMIVSRGLGNSIIPFRINNNPEIVVAELTKIAD